MANSGGNKKYYFGTAVVVLLLLCVGGYFIFRPKRYEKFTDLLVLRYGDPCDLQVEEIRDNLTFPLLNLFLKNQDTLGGYHITGAKERLLLQKQKPLCNLYQQLVCNRTTARCGCGDSSASTHFGEAAVEKMYVTERGPVFGGYKQCRAAMNTYCLPWAKDSGLKAERQGLIFDMGCEAGNSCKSVRRKGKHCTNEELKYYLEYYGSHNYENDLVSGKICTCQVDNAYLANLDVLH